MGFLRVLDQSTLAFADFSGNQQLLSTGNIDANERVSLFLMDYKNRERLKIMGNARIEDARSDSDFVRKLSAPNERKQIERVVVIDVLSFDWNCPKYIAPRYTIQEVEELAGSLRTRIAELEIQLRAVKA